MAKTYKSLQGGGKTLVVAAALFACATADAAVTTVTVEPGDVTSLTNYMATLDKGSTIILKPGLYDLSGVYTTIKDYTYCHLCANQRWFYINGANTKHWSEKTPEEETILRGDGTASILFAHGGGGRPTSVRHITFENGYRPAKAPDGTSIGNTGGGALSWVQTEQFNMAQGYGLATNCVFRNCGSAYYGGATYGISSFDCFYTNNVSATGGGAAHGLCGTNGSKTYHTNLFVNCVFIGNTTTNGAGGAIYAQQLDSLTGDVFIGNTATKSSMGGGAVYSETPMSAITGCVFTNNVCGWRGGGVKCSGAIGTVSNCVFCGNVAQNDRGGGLRMDGDAGRIVDCEFAGNEAMYNGGAISNGGGDLFNVENCGFAGNILTGVYDENDGGGAISSISVMTTLSGCSFVGNTAERSGGAVVIRNDFVVSNCTFRENVAQRFCGGLCSLGSTKGLVTGCTFESNTNKWGNFGAHLRWVEQVTDCTFTGWGDVMAKSYDRCTFDGCRFSFATWSDGMVQFDPTTGAGHIRNCLFRDCSVHTLIYNVSAQPLEIANCTFAGNAIATMSFMNGDKPQVVSPYLIFAHRNGTDPVTGGAYPCTNTLVNCIFWNNTRDGVRNDVNFYATGLGTIPGTVARNIVSNSIYGTRNTAYDSGSRSETAFSSVSNPHFIAGDPSYPDAPYYMIRATSPAYDTGLNMDWMTDASDLCGTNRIIGASADMGCYESWLPLIGTMFILR